MSCPKCNSDAGQEIIYDFGYGLSLRCSGCGHYYEIFEPREELDVDE